MKSLLLMRESGIPSAVVCILAILALTYACSFGGPANAGTEVEATPTSTNLLSGRGGVGLLLKTSGDYPSVQGVLEGTPAAACKALTNGVLVTAVAQGGTSSPFQNTKGMPLKAVSQLISGAAGTKVTLQVRQPQDLANQSEPLVIELVRASLPSQRFKTTGSFHWEHVEHNVTHEASEDRFEWPPNRGFIQPEYRAWRKLSLGMDASEVRALLGAPVRMRGEADGPAVGLWDYGFVERASEVVPTDLTFSVVLSGAKVVSIEDPFDGRFSDDGMPTAPEPAWPLGRATFRHFPRLFDIRWLPASGEYPMNYEIALEIRTTNGWHASLYKTSHSFLPAVFPGANLGRWRVRGVNALGPGAWSEYQEFEFLR